MKLTKALLAVVAMLFCVSVSANAQATVAMTGLGSSGLFLQLGEAAVLSPTIAAPCVWTAKSAANIVATDSRVSLNEAGQVWVAWSAGTGTCSAPAGSYKIYFYLQTDSTVGDRCLLASPACTLTFPSSLVGTRAGDNLLSPIADVTYVPAAVQAALDGRSFDVAGTDIRPEDAKFATIRALTDCGVPVNGVAGSQYLGLGYAQSSGSHVGNAIQGSAAGGGGSFNVIDFNLTGNDPISGNPVSSFKVYDVGADPIVVFVNPSNSAGFGSILVQNLTRGVLAGYLDGTYGRASDAINQAYAASSGASAYATTVFVREPLSGTYNTMEYAIPNNSQLKTSQDVGLNSPVDIDPLSQNCTSIGGTVSQNPLQDGVSRGTPAGTSYRYRAIGTGNEVASVLATTDALGYSFWGTGNFKNAKASTAKYLTVDGIDPLQQVWTDGLVPTTGNGLLGNVSFANVKNGSYPIWSKLRMAATPTGQTGASALASAVQSFISPTAPDFVPISQLLIVRSHFAPPYNASSAYNAAFPSSGTNQPANGTNPCDTGAYPEAGGDVGGLVYTLQSDGDFCQDSGSHVGQVGRRQ